MFEFVWFLGNVQNHVFIFGKKQKQKHLRIEKQMNPSVEKKEMILKDSRLNLGDLA